MPFKPEITGVDMVLAPEPPPMLAWAELDTQRQSYEEIWEQDGKWLMGRAILAEIVRHWMTATPLVESDAARRSLSICASMPTVRDEFSGEQVSIFYTIPPEMRDLFINRCEMAFALRWPSWSPGFAEYLGHAMSPVAIAAVKVVMHVAEQAARARGLPELWQIGAVCFGLTEREVIATPRPFAQNEA